MKPKLIVMIMCIILIMITTAQRNAIVFPTYDKVYYRYLPATETNTLIVFPRDIYRYSITRDGAGADTVFIWYKTSPTDSTKDGIPPTGGNMVTALYEYGPPLNDDNGVRFISGASTALIIKGVYR
jgi:hypothetical protein